MHGGIGSAILAGSGQTLVPTLILGCISTVLKARFVPPCRVSMLNIMSQTCSHRYQPDTSRVRSFGRLVSTMSDQENILTKCLGGRVQRLSASVVDPSSSSQCQSPRCVSYLQSLSTAVTVTTIGPASTMARTNYILGPKVL